MRLLYEKNAHLFYMSAMKIEGDEFKQMNMELHNMSIFRVDSSNRLILNIQTRNNEQWSL